MSKALIEKAFEKWWQDFSIEHKYELDTGVLKLEYLLTEACKFGATWQREQLECSLIKGRCKDCKFFNGKYCSHFKVIFSDGFVDLDGSDSFPSTPEPNDYCSDFLAKLDLLERE